MFGHGLESLLKRENRVAVIGRETNVEQALEQIKTLQPTVVILDSDEFSKNDLSSVVQVMKVNPGSKVIGLSLQNNRAYIYHITEKNVGSAEDLFQLITVNTSG